MSHLSRLITKLLFSFLVIMNVLMSVRISIDYWNTIITLRYNTTCPWKFGKWDFLLDIEELFYVGLHFGRNVSENIRGLY